MPPHNSARRWLGLARLILGLGLLVWVLLATQAWRAFEHLTATPSLLLIFIFQALVGASLEARRLALLIRSRSVELDFFRSLRLVAMAVTFGYVVPGGVGGDLIKILHLGNRHRSQRVELAAVVLVDRVTGLLSLLSVALATAVLTGGLASAPGPLRILAGLAGLGLLLTLAALLAAWSPAVRRSRVYHLVTRKAPFHQVLARGLDALWTFREHKLAIVAAVALSALGHLALLSAFVLGGRVMLPAAPAGDVAWISLLALVANLLPLTPGGLGVGEAAFEAAFGLAGYAGGAQLLVAWRAGQLPFAIAGGLLYALGGRGGADAPQGEPANG